MNMTKFKVASCNPNKEGKFVWKLIVEVSVKVFGINKTVKRTYYLGGMPAAVNVGTEMMEDMDKFEVKEYAYNLVDEKTGEATVLMLKWLHAKPIAA
jgi:hypothetical protein